MAVVACTNAFLELYMLFQKGVLARFSSFTGSTAIKLRATELMKILLLLKTLNKNLIINKLIAYKICLAAWTPQWG